MDTSDQFLMFKLDRMAEEYEKNRHDIIRMTLGKSELDLNINIVAGMIKAMLDTSKRTKVYPEGLPELKKALANYYESTYKLESNKINIDNIIISTGTSALFRNIYQALLHDGDEILLPKPYYPLYIMCAKILPKIIIKFYNIDLNTLKIDFESISNNFNNKTKIIVLNSPGNPLGNIITKNEMIKIDNIVNRRAVIISDEIYENMYFNDDMRYSLLQLDIKSPYIITNSFSKAYRMYTSRVGWCIIGNNNNLSSQLTILQEHTLLTTDPVAQYGGIKAFKYQQDVNLGNVHLLNYMNQWVGFILQLIVRI